MISKSTLYQKLNKYLMIVAYRERSFQGGAVVALAIGRGAVVDVVEDAANAVEAVDFRHASNLIVSHVVELL